MRARVVVTGMGVISPLGVTLQEFSQGLFAGRSGIGPITRFDASNLPTRIAGEVPGAHADGAADFKIEFALRAAEAAYADAVSRPGLEPGLEHGGAEAGLSLGVGLELFSLEDMAAHWYGRRELPESVVERMTFLQTPADLAVHLISHRYDLRRPPLTHISACAAGTDAIGAAFRMVADGRRRWMLAGGTDSMINPLGLGGFCKIGATSRANEDPRRASRPFDARRDGFVLGEGAGMVVLERIEDARARGAFIHAEVLGYGNSFDAHGISEPHPEGRGAYQAMARALADAGLEPADVDVIKAHGTSTPKNDPIETLAIKRLLGPRAAEVPISAPKSMLGHLISAAGAVEAIGAIVGMAAGRVPPTINLEEPDPACDLDYVPGRAREFEHGVVLANSFGFGGHNACIVLGKGTGLS